MMPPYRLVLWFALLRFCMAWNSDEMEMFDLVEELKMSFYDYLGIEPTASSAEIRRSYRKLSAELHPDRNPDDPDASVKFRRLVKVYDILKNEESREQYNDVLKNGLPDWRTPVFYYRKLRRMSNMELLIIFSVLSTVIHYAVLWGSRYEKLWTLEDQLSTAYKRHKARDKKRDAIDMQIAEHLREIPRPQWHDILPFAICKWFYSFALFLPVLFFYLKTQLITQIKHYTEKFKTDRELTKEFTLKEKVKQGRQERKRRVVGELKSEEQSAYDPEVLGAYFSLSDIPSDKPDDSAECKDSDFSSNIEWSEQDTLNLVRAIARFPGGVSERWTRIAETVGRSVSEVISKAKQLGEKNMNRVYLQDQMASQIPVFETNMNAICGESSDDEAATEGHEQIAPAVSNSCSTMPNRASSEAELAENEEINVLIDEPYLSRKKLKQQKLNACKERVSDCKVVDMSDGWSQVEQKQLEVAIRAIDKSTQDRWDRIAECVPSKTKAEVMLRVRQLSNLVKARASRA